MYIAPGQGQTAPRGQNLDVNRKALSLYPFVVSFKEISLKSDCLFEIRKIAVCFLWLTLPGDCRVTDEALLAETK